MSRVDTRSRASSAAEEGADAILDRLSQTVGSSVPTRPSEATLRFYRDKRVLVTNGGEVLGPALVRELARAGASVTVHLTSPREAERFSVAAGERVTFRAGAFDRESEVAGLLGAAEPDVVFHVLSMRAKEVANEADYMWRRNVRGCEALCAGLERSATTSVVLARVWDESRPEEPWVLMAALSEALVLNRPRLVRASPKAARIPPVLTGEKCRRLSRSVRAGVAPEERFALLEDEAVTFLLNAGASHAGRLIFIPAPAGSFGLLDVIHAAGEGAVSPPGTPAGPDPGVFLPLFPNETARPSVTAGVKQVVSPLCPASASLIRHGVGAGASRRRPGRRVSWQAQDGALRRIGDFGRGETTGRLSAWRTNPV